MAAAGDIKAQFDAAVEFVRSGFHPTKTVPDERKLAVYALFKQATVGDVNTERPGMFSFEGRAKWDAWNAKKGISSEDAMRAYIAEVDAQKSEFA